MIEEDKPRRKTVDLRHVQRATDLSQRQLAYYAYIIKDPALTERLKESFCQLCYYSSRIGGCMMTSQQCGMCEKVMGFGNTCVDVLCKECALKHKLCRRCGGSVTGKQRRKL